MKDEMKVMYTLKFPSGLYQAYHPAHTTSDCGKAVRYRTPVDLAAQEHICPGDQIIRLVREDAPGEWEEVPEGEEPEEGAEVRWVMIYSNSRSGYWPSNPLAAPVTLERLVEKWAHHAWWAGQDNTGFHFKAVPIRLQRHREPRWRDDGGVR